MVSRAVDGLREAIDALVDDVVTGVSQREDLSALARELSRLDAQFARRLAELDQSVEWSVDGARSAAGWLAANTRMASGEAHHRAKIARQTSAMPLAAAAWAAGTITSRHVDALSAVRNAAQADAEFAVFEPALVEVALTGRPEAVANVGKQWRDALDSHLDRDDRRIREHERRAVRFSRSIGGLGFLEGTFDADGAEIIETALDRSYQRAHQAGDPRTPAQQRADAVIEIFSRYLDGQQRGTNRPHVMLLGDAATVSGEAVGTCETLSGHRLHPDTLRRFACDAILQRAVVDTDGVVLDLGRAARTFTPDQYRAMAVRDGGCRWPCCGVGPEDCEGHHLEFYEHGGKTDLGNGVLGCRSHHWQVHEGGFTITGDPNGELTFRDPDGKIVGTTRPRKRPPPALTRDGVDVERARARAYALAARPAA